MILELLKTISSALKEVGLTAFDAIMLIVFLATVLPLIIKGQSKKAIGLIQQFYVLRGRTFFVKENRKRKKKNNSQSQAEKGPQNDTDPQQNRP